MAGCVLCDLGRLGNNSRQNSTFCELCDAGKIAAKEGQEECTVCPSGTFTNARRTSCDLCEAGTFAKNGSGSCEPCPTGSFAEAGRASCEPCPAGSFADRVGQEACANCNDTFMSRIEAKSADDCQCPAEMRFDLSQARCILCDDELKTADIWYCPGGHKQTMGLSDDLTPMIRQGYMSLQTNRFSVYDCVDEKRCKGLRSPFNYSSMCGKGFNSSVPRCAVCNNGLYLSL